jgi:hypothetical protein
MIVDGKRVGLFHEDGGIIAVEVVKDLSDEEWERLRLKCVRMVLSSKIVIDSEVGEEFEVCRMKGPDGCYVGWFLEEEGLGVEEAFRGSC